MKRYAKAVVGAETFTVGDYVFVNHSPSLAGAGAFGAEDDSQAAEITPGTWREYWVGRLLEVRAADAAHVWVRVFWMYWPDEIPENAVYAGEAGGKDGNKGREFYGYGELVASNHMDVVDATTIAGRAEVEQWMEEEEGEEMVFEDKLYWRQKFDYPSKTLSVRSPPAPRPLSLGLTRLPGTPP